MRRDAGNALFAKPRLTVGLRRAAPAEIFGSVAAIQSFSDQDDVIRLANDTDGAA
jgi:acyl-CoA reductase-like NAD-dependent aldehyde dehydrogenase